MQYHTYDRDTGVHVGSAVAHPDPAEHAKLIDAAKKADPMAPKPEPTRFLIPAFATTIATPPVGDGERAVFADGAWRVEPIPVEVNPFAPVEEGAA